MAQQGVPDVVIAAAGISIGVDTAQRTDLEVIDRAFAGARENRAARLPEWVARSNILRQH